VLHGSIAATSRIGPFSYVMVIGFVIHLSADDFGWIARWFGKPSRARTVIYDADCGICLFLCRLLKRLDPFERLEFVGNQDQTGALAELDAATLEKTIVVLAPDGRVFIEERAVFEIARALPFGWLPALWLRVPGLSLLGHGLYRAVADNRVAISVWFGFEACGIAPALRANEAHRPIAAGDSWYAELAATLAVVREGLVLLLLFVLGTQLLVENPWAFKRVHVKRPDWVAKVIEYPRIYEGWSMFAPEPPHDDGHLVVDGRTRDGRRLDPITGEEPVLDPYSATGWGDDQLWCDYSNRIRSPSNVPYRAFYRDYLVRWHEFTDRPEDSLASFDVWWVQNKSPAPGEERGQPLPPERITSYGAVRDSLATPWLRPAAESVSPFLDMKPGRSPRSPVTGGARP
jgi:predicted DCC family thiol-disulfide oxidoreductase YuxK